jgi:hypothetical protein
MELQKMADRVVRMYIAPETYRPDVSGFRVVEYFYGPDVLVDQVRTLSDFPNVLYFFSRADLFSSYVNSALLKIVEEGRASFMFQANSSVGCNAALLSRCNKVFISETVAICSLENIRDVWGLTHAELSLVQAVLKIKEMPYREIIKDPSVRFNLVFSALSEAYTHKNVFEDVKYDVWMKIKSVISKPFFRGNRYSYIALWRGINYG